MSSDTNTKTSEIHIVVSPDRLQAWIELPGASAPTFSPPDESAIVGALREREIDVTGEVHGRVRQYLEIIGGPAPGDAEEGRPEIPERFLIAEGRPAKDAKNGEFERDKAFDQQSQDWQGDAPVNYYVLNSILTIEADTTVGRIIPPTMGEPGVDVHGNEVRPTRMKGLPMKLGEGLRMAGDDSLQVVTDVAGRLEQQGNMILMQQLLTVSGDVDFESGNVDSVIDVHVRGSIKPKFSVRTTKSLTIERAVEAAKLDVGGDIQVRGGFFGQGAGYLIKAGGSITASICDAAELEAAGDIHIAKEIINSRVRTSGELRIEYGSILDGEICARNGVKVKHAGSEACVPTRIAAGMDGAALYRAQQMDKQVKKHHEQAEQIRRAVQPLLANMRRLTPGQREQAMELMAKVDEIELARDGIVARRDQILKQAKPDGNPGVEISGILHQGVVLVFGLRETTMKTGIKGPIRVEERKVEGVTEIVIVNSLTGSVIVLPSVAVDVEYFQKAERESGDADGAGQDRRDEDDT